MATKIQVRRDTSANWTSINPTLFEGEIGFETNTGKLKVGRSNISWNNLPYAVDDFVEDYLGGSKGTGNWWQPISGPVTSQAVISGSFYQLPVAHAFYISESVTVDRLAVHTSAIGTGVLRLGLYNHDTSTGRPSSLIQDYGTVSVTSTGVKELTITETLTRGWYYLVMCWQSDNTTAFTYSTGLNTTSPFAVHISTSSSAGLNSSRTSIFRGTVTTTGALPASLSTAASFNIANPIRFAFRTA